jgi:hypothetical protein
LDAGEYREVVQFGYERFGDHAIAKYLLDTHLDPQDPAASFAPSEPLGRLLADEWRAWSERGIIEAVSVQLPERVGLELAEAAEHAEDFESVRAGFVESLVWRRGDSIGERALDLVGRELGADYEARGTSSRRPRPRRDGPGPSAERGTSPRRAAQRADAAARQLVVNLSPRSVGQDGP